MPRDRTELEILGPDEEGCAYLDDLNGRCGAPVKRGGNPYCAPHHALCYVVMGSHAELARIAEIESAAAFVGGRSSRTNPSVPPQRFMRALDQRQRQ